MGLSKPQNGRWWKRSVELIFVSWLAISVAPMFAQAADPTRVTEDAVAQSKLGPPSARSGLVAANIDAGTRPQADLFRYANGAWLDKVAIPADRARWGIDDVMAEENLLQLRRLLEGAQKTSDASARKAGALYASFTDAERVELLGATPLRAMLGRIDAVQSAAGLSRAMAELLPQAVRLPVAVFVAADAKDSRHYAAYFTQGGLGLPDRDYYLIDNEKFVAVRKAYRDHIDRMLRLIGDADSAAAADRILDLESRLAKAQWKRTETRDAVKSYNPVSAAALQRRSGGLVGPAFLAAIGIAANAKLVVRQPSYLEQMGGLFATVPLQTWKDYLRFQSLAAYAAYLSDGFVRENFAFRGTVLVGTPEMAPRWRRAVQLVDTQMGDASGRLYVAKHFSPDTKARVAALVVNVVAAFGQSIDESDWMSPQTKAEARAKLAKLRVKIGYPRTWRSYAGLRIVASDLVGNVARARLFNWRFQAARAGRPIDDNDFAFTAPTVNASYNHTLNEATFPAGILQSPMFNATASDAYNYGATGATIGHEIMHGFDDQGSRYDGDGQLRDWWTAEDRRRYEAKLERLVAQYGEYEPVPGFKLDGRLTLGENVADLAGAEIAYRAYHLSLGGSPAPVIEGLSGDQLFYLGYAQSLLRKQREELSIAELKSDPHSPAENRVNAVVVNMPGFHEAFDVKPTDPMYRAPDQRTQVWP